MTDEDGELRATAVRNLKELGLSEYAARTLVALTVLGQASARAVSEESAVPRTRVYDAVDELEERGFVTVREGDPKLFVPVSPDRIRREFFREYVYRLALVVWSLEVVAAGDAEPAVAAERDPDAIDRRFAAAIDDATHDLTYVPVDATPPDRTLAALASAGDRGVDLRVLTIGTVDVAAIERALPDATVRAVDDVEGCRHPPTRLLLVDGDRALAGLTAANGDEVGLFTERPDTPAAELLATLVASVVDDFA